MWSIFNFLSSVWRKLNWLINFVKVFITPIYDELVKIINDVSATDLENEAARGAVFQKITDYIKSKGLNISDSIINLSIEIVYQLTKRGRA